MLTRFTKAYSMAPPMSLAYCVSLQRNISDPDFIGFGYFIYQWSRSVHSLSSSDPIDRRLSASPLTALRPISPPEYTNYRPLHELSGRDRNTLSTAVTMQGRCTGANTTDDAKYNCRTLAAADE